MFGPLCQSYSYSAFGPPRRLVPRGVRSFIPVVLDRPAGADDHLQPRRGWFVARQLAGHILARAPWTEPGDRRSLKTGRFPHFFFANNWRRHILPRT